MTYTLYDVSSGNRIGTYMTKAAALDAVRREVRANNDLQDLALEQYDGLRVVVVGEGADLLRQSEGRASEVPTHEVRAVRAGN